MTQISVGWSVGGGRKKGVVISSLPIPQISHVCLCQCVHVCANRTHLCVSVHGCVSMCVYVFLCMCVGGCTCVCECMCAYVCVSMCVHPCVVGVEVEAGNETVQYAEYWCVLRTQANSPAVGHTAAWDLGTTMPCVLGDNTLRRACPEVQV